MRCLALLSCLALAACNAPSPYFRGQAAERVVIETNVFDVRVRGELAEAVRLSRGWTPRLHGIVPYAEAAMERVSGCDVVRITGDQALLLGELECGPQRRRTRSAPRLYTYVCDPVEAWDVEALKGTHVSFDCAPEFR